MFSPELSQHWIPDQERPGGAAASASRESKPLSPSQQDAQEEALAALADRINAARSVV